MVFFSQTENAKGLLVILSNLMRSTRNDTTAISPGIDQKAILFLHESSICSSASFKTTASSLCWLATAPAYLGTTHPGKEKNHQTSGGFLSELSPALSPCQLPAFFFQRSLCNRFDDYSSCISSLGFQLDVTYKPELLFCSTILLSATHSFSCP